MSKPTHEELVETTADYLSTYVGAGVSVDPVIQNLDPETNISGLTELLEYQFLLSGRRLDPTTDIKRSQADLCISETGGIVDRNQIPIGILDFVSLLEHRLRSIDPAIHQELQAHQGEVRGTIDWNQTIKHRYSDGDIQGDTFVCKNQERTVQTTQNRVLLELLHTIQTILVRFDKTIEPDDDSIAWFSVWHRGSEMRQTLENAVNNVYLSELDGETLIVSNRELREVLSDRRPLYREAATLLQTHRRIREGKITDQQAKKLFQMELFAPSNEDDGTADLFELYWIFELLKQFEQPRFQHISGSRGQLVALWEADGVEYMLFNDWQGHHRWDDDREFRNYLQIEFDVSDIEPERRTDANTHEFVQRHQSVIRHKYAINERVFEYGQGRKTPDIVLLGVDKSTEPPTLEHVFIGEVKHSTSRGTIEEGVQQLLEYGAHAKIGPHLQLDRDVNTPYIAVDPDFLNTPELELGYFVGDADLIIEQPFESLQICGYGDIPNHPFA